MGQFPVGTRLAWSGLIAGKASSHKGLRTWALRRELTLWERLQPRSAARPSWNLSPRFFRRTGSTGFMAAARPIAAEATPTWIWGLPQITQPLQSATP